jgi:hypothetical protein
VVGLEQILSFLLLLLLVVEVEVIGHLLKVLEGMVAPVEERGTDDLEVLLV